MPMGVIFIERAHLSCVLAFIEALQLRSGENFIKIYLCMKGLLWCLRALSKKGSCERKWLLALIICCRSSGGQTGCTEPKPPHSYTTMLGRACLLACALLLLTAGAASGGALLLALLSSSQSLRLTLATLCKAATRWWLPTCNLGGVQVPQTRTRSSGRQERSQGAVGQWRLAHCRRCCCGPLCRRRCGLLSASLPERPALRHVSRPPSHPGTMQAPLKDSTKKITADGSMTLTWTGEPAHMHAEGAAVLLLHAAATRRMVPEQQQQQQQQLPVNASLCCGT